MYNLSEEEKEFGINSIKKYIKNYSDKVDETSEESLIKWLIEEFEKEFPNKSNAEIEEKVKGIITGINMYYKEKERILFERSKGKTSNDIVAENVIEDLVEIIDEDTNIDSLHKSMKEVNENLSNKIETDLYNISYAHEPIITLNTIREKSIVEKNDNIKSMIDNIFSGYAARVGINYGNNIEKTIQMAIAESNKAIYTKSGAINQNPSLDGFIFEELHAGIFNIDSAVKGKKYIAEALKPDVYGKNSIDIVVREGKQVVSKLQANLYSDWEKTENAFYDSTGYKYNFQKKLVSEEQAKYIKNSVSKIEYDGVKSKGLTKQEVKELTQKVQEGQTKLIEKEFRESIETKALAKQIGIKTINSAALGFAGGMIFNMGSKLISGDEVTVEETVVSGLEGGTRAGLATAVSAGLSSWGSKMTGSLGRILSNSVVAGGVGAAAVDVISAGYKLGKGEYSFSEATSEISSSILAGMAMIKTTGIITTALGVTAATLFTPIGIAALATSLVAGSVVSTYIKTGLNQIFTPIVKNSINIVKGGYNMVKNTSKGIVNLGKSLVSKVKNSVGNIFNGLGTILGF